MGDIIFVTGIGTGVGKTIVSAILTEALEADYWKPVQSGLDETTDTDTVKSLISNKKTKFWKEAFRLNTPASPHLSARIDNVHIDLENLVKYFNQRYDPQKDIIIEGAGGLMVPLNEKDLFIDLIALLKAKVIVVSNQYLGSINHSLLTAQVLASSNLNILGWIFNGTYHTFEEDITRWSRFENVGRIEWADQADKKFVKSYANKIGPRLFEILGKV